MTGRPRQSPMHRFVHRFVIDGNGCWLWTGSTITAGYPQMSIDGVHTVMHRWSYEHFVGPIPEGMFVCHRCDVKRCVNPTHLEAASVGSHDTHAELVGRLKRRCRKLEDEKAELQRQLEEARNQ